MLLVSYDSKYLFSTNGACLNVFSISSGELVYRLAYNTNQQQQLKQQHSHEEEKAITSGSHSSTESLIIKSICINPTNKYQLFSFHLGGRVCLWDYEDGLLLKSFETKLLIKKVIKTETTLYALGKLRTKENKTPLTSTNKNNNNNNNKCKQLVNSRTTESAISSGSGGDSNDSGGGGYSLYKLAIDETLKNKTQLEHQLVLSDLNLNTNKMAIAIDSEGKYVAYIEDNKSIVINQFNKHNNLGQVKRIKAKKELTCLAIHPNEDCIAAGTVQGQIILWYNYFSADCEAKYDNNELQMMDTTCQENGETHSVRLRIKPVRNVLHWHSLPVLCLQFTTEGSFLLSGGYECVLVKWMHKTGQKDFLPRLGAPLSEIVSAKDNTLYAVQHSDNIIHIISTGFSVLQTFSGFVCPNFAVSKSTDTFYPAGINYFTKLNCFLSNGRPGHLQFYSHGSDKLLFNLDISDENYISPENLNKPLSNSEIECVALNHDSTWLVTVERRNDNWTMPETRLKFWYFDQTTNKFSLNTLVRQPHSFDRINKIKFKPNENVLFSCGEDGCFKSWVLRENRQQASSNESSSITSNWIYATCNGFRDMTPNDIEFVSLNSSNLDLLAVSFNHVVTIWLHSEQDGMSFINDLIHCDSSDLVKQLKFVGSSHLLVAHENYLNLWSVNDGSNEKILMKCKWSIQINNMLFMATHPTDSNQVVMVFNEKTNANSTEDDSLTNLQVTLFDLNNPEYLIKNVYSFDVYQNNKLHFICLKRTDYDEKSNDIDEDEGEDEQEKNESIGKDLFKKINIFYCDNRGLLEKVVYKSKKKSLSTNIDVDLSESMWNSRRQLSKNMPKSNLTAIIDLHKSNKLIDSQLANGEIESENNLKFEAKLSKIETTPAYLLPKVGSFCYEILKSMLQTYETSDEDTDETNSKNNKPLLNGNKLANTNISSSSEESDQEDETNGLKINKHNGSDSRLEKDLVLNSKYPQLTKNIFI